MLKPADTCPACHAPKALENHCPPIDRPVCGWVKCDACKATINATTGRGLTYDGEALTTDG